jgi:beta-phosphoglucomutase-like phosphatase (HAD superfamily)
VRAFLASRGVVLPEGLPEDPPDADTVWGVGNRKNELLLATLERDGVEVYEAAAATCRPPRDAGLRRAVVSTAPTPPRSCGDRARRARRAAGRRLTPASGSLPGKPAPDTFLAGRADLGVTAAQAVVFEDALSGVQAGRAGGFALVIGVDRVGQAEALAANGADVVVQDLEELL